MVEVVEEAVGDVARRHEADAGRHFRRNAVRRASRIARGGHAVEGGPNASAEHVVMVIAHADEGARRGRSREAADAEQVRGRGVAEARLELLFHRGSPGGVAVGGGGGGGAHVVDLVGVFQPQVRGGAGGSGALLSRVSAATISAFLRAHRGDGRGEDTCDGDGGEARHRGPVRVVTCAVVCAGWEV